MDSNTRTAETVAQKVAHELREYLVISAYLYVCFGALLLYKMALLEGQGVSYVPYGIAAIKALVLGKFILLGHAFGLGERVTEHVIIYLIARKALLFALMLLALSFIEEIISGAIHGHTIAETLSTFLGGTILQVLATSLIMLLILIPYLTFYELDEALGEAGVRRILMETRAGHRGANRLGVGQGGSDPAGTSPNEAPRK